MNHLLSCIKGALEGGAGSHTVGGGRSQGSNFMRDQDSFVDCVFQVQWSFKLEQRVLDDNLAFSKDEGVVSSLNI